MIWIYNNITVHTYSILLLYRHLPQWYYVLLRLLHHMYIVPTYNIMYSIMLPKYYYNINNAIFMNKKRDKN